MSSPVSILATIVLALGAVEATAYWWMHPAPAGRGQPVLVYQPSRSAGVSPASEKPETGDHASEIGDRESELRDEESSPLNSPTSTIPDPQSSPFLSTLNPPPSTSSTTTPLPAVVANALPALRCSTGTAARIDRDDGTIFHLAFFEWNLADSTNVLEAFKHLPDECMGSIGMILTAQLPPRSYQVGAETLWFDHTVFRDSVGITVHAFKGTWVSGANSLIGSGERGGVDQWNQLRWKSALKRFKPAHARVAQGAVRSIPNPDLAWQAFEETMLKDLKFQ